MIGTGSGFLVNEAGWVLTNAHVVESCDFVEHESPGHAASVIKDPEADLALALFRGPHEGAPLVSERSRPA